MALIAGLALAEGVNSANTVGFQNKEVEGTGFTSISPTFVAVGTQDPLTLADLSGTFIEGESVLFSDTDFATESEYFYCVKGSLVETATGWYADDFETPAGVTAVAAGQGFLFQNASANSGITITFTAPVID